MYAQTSCYLNFNLMKIFIFLCLMSTKYIINSIFLYFKRGKFQGVTPAPVAPTPAAPHLLPKGAVAVPLVTNQHAMDTRSKSGYRMRAAFHAAPLSPVPKSFRSALADPNWQAAMEEEHSALLKNHT
jgi:hypothetical protein